MYEFHVNFVRNDEDLQRIKKELALELINYIIENEAKNKAQCKTIKDEEH